MSTSSGDSSGDGNGQDDQEGQDAKRPAPQYKRLTKAQLDQVLLTIEDLPPGYQQVGISHEQKRGKLRLLAAPPGSDGDPATTINQNALLYVVDLGPGDAVQHPLATGRHGKSGSFDPFPAEIPTAREHHSPGTSPIFRLNDTR